MSNDELDKFRKDSENEISKRKRNVGSSNIQSNNHTDDNNNDNNDNEQVQLNNQNNNYSYNTAIKFYNSAIEYERIGQLNEALNFYRRAFKLDDEIDKNFEKYTKQKASFFNNKVDNDNNNNYHDNDNIYDDFKLDKQGNYVYNFSKTIQLEPDAPTQSTNRSDAVDSIIQSLSSFQFEPEDENKKFPISILPDEVFTNIFYQMISTTDVQTLIRFARTSKKLLMLSNDNVIWKTLVKHHYKPPHQISYKFDIQSFVNKQFNGNWRKFWIDIPRIRLDGVYISICHYLRHGIGESAWNSFTQLVTFYRYLRFYDDGTVIHLLTSIPPTEIVPSINKELHMKGISHGYWKLRKENIDIWSLKDPSKPENCLKYIFKMSAKLKSSIHGKHNKIDLLEYFSLNLNLGEELPLPLKVRFT